MHAPAASGPSGHWPQPSEPGSTRRTAIELAAVVAASLAVSLPFCNKAFHIDDTLYLSIARQILADPWRPFSGTINWQQVSEPAWQVSISPPGYSYWLAGCIAVGLESELALHLAGSLWTVLLGLATYWWAKRLCSWPVAATVLVLASPLVTAGQNLMLDVPTLALSAAAAVLYLTGSEQAARPLVLLAAGVLAGLAVNTKYSGLVVIAAMAADAVIWRRWGWLIAPLVGLAMFATWQVVSAVAYGEPQIVHARRWIARLWPLGGWETWHRVSSSMLYLGSSTAWLVLLAVVLRRRWRLAVVAILAGIGGAWAAATDLRWQEPGAGTVPLSHAAVFAFSGWATATWVLGRMCTSLASRLRCWLAARRPASGSRPAASAPPDSASRLRDGLLLSLWAAGFWYVGTLNGPFVAPRAMLPCLLAGVLAFAAVGNGRATPGPAARAIAVLVALAMGLTVGAADYQWAGLYRQWAGRLARQYRPEQGHLYFLGHWGWQYYAQASGMVPFDPLRSVPTPGDVLVVPANVDRQVLPAAVKRRAELIGWHQVSSGRLLPRTRAPGGLIFFHGDTRAGRIPWGWTAVAEPLEQFAVLEVVGPARPP